MKNVNEILACEKQLIQAIKDNDVEKLNQLLHEDILFVNPLGQTQTKAMDMKNYQLGAVKIEHLEAENYQINIIDYTAVVSVTINLRGEYLEHQLNESYQYFRVWQQNRSSGWKVIGGSCVKI